MDKDVKKIMNIEKRNNQGFSLVEFITAIGILGVLTVAVVLFMSSSSKTYSNLSVESQLQSEAQLVANMITELAIDSYDAQSLTEDFGYDTTANKQLVLNSLVDGDEKQYIFGRKTATNELYLAERTYTPGTPTGSWGAASEALLGNYITDFTVDTSRVENENMLEFTLCYEKSGRTYESKHQVFMRNKAYADNTPETTTQDTASSVAIKIDPKLVFIDIVNETVPAYYIGTVSDANKRTLGASAEIPFTSTVVSNKTLDNKDVNWELKNEDENMFEMTAATGETSSLKWKNSTTNKFSNSPMDAFTLVITKTVNDGTKVVEASPKTAQILLRRIKSINLYAVNGSTQWKADYDLLGGTASTEAQGYAYIGSNGKYLPMNLSASVLASNIAHGGGLTWELYNKNSSGDWVKCTNSSLASLQNEITQTSMMNTVNFGSSAANGQLYKVVATSIFDPSYSAEYVFGVAPKSGGDDDGFYSRGYYINMSEFLSREVEDLDPDDSETGLNWKRHVQTVKYLAVTKVDLAGNSADSADKVKVIQDDDGNWRLYMDFDAFSYGTKQKEDYYTGQVGVHLVVGYISPEGYWCISNGSHKEDMKNKLGLTDSDFRYPVEINGTTQWTDTVYGLDYIYMPNPVVVSKISPTNSLIVLEKGDASAVRVKTAYYNLLSPRKGTYYFGTYIEDMYNNLIEPGKKDINAYFSVEMISGYGDTNAYVDEAIVRVTAKGESAQKKYLTDPVKLRLAANDFYTISDSPNENSYTDYMVIIANVKGMECYIPGPNATYSGLAWPSAAETATSANPVTITGYDTSGNQVTAKVYKNGKKYCCEYGGKTYTYNKAYNFWTN